MNKPLQYLSAATIVVAAIVILSCNKKMSATSPSKETALKETAAKEAAVKETEAREKEAAHTALLTAGKTIYTGKCTRCHEAKPVANWNAEEWKPILKSMIKKTRLDSLESAQVTAYVNEHCKK